MRVEVDMFPDMFSADDLDRLRDHISRSVADQLLQDSSINWTNLQRLDKPVLCIQARLQDGATHEPAEMGMFSVSRPRSKAYLSWLILKTAYRRPDGHRHAKWWDP